MAILDVRNENFMCKAVCHSIGSLSDSESKDFFEKVCPGEKRKNINIELFANGVSLPIEEFFKYLEENIDLYINEKAVEIIKDKFENIQDETEKFQENIKEIRRACIKKMAETLNVNLDDEDLYY